jgi:hypothetical protein
MKKLLLSLSTLLLPVLLFSQDAKEKGIDEIIN